MNELATFKQPSETVASLNYYLERLPGTGASGLLYILLEHPYNNKYTASLQCFDANGKLLWEEKQSKAGWSETGATNAVLNALEKKLEPRIGGPGLPLKQDTKAAGKDKSKE